ncbi:MAG: peptidoglycan editing factor PgeF [Pelagibacteraceae bacterium]
MIIASKKISKIKNINGSFFSRKGGVSKGIYKSLNLGLGSNDNKKNVKKNLLIVKKKLKIKNIYLLKQIHSNKIIILKKKYKTLRVAEADGLFTNLNNIGIGILTADCVPILFSSSCGKFICAIHAGWKGIYKGIIKNAIKLFKKNKVNPNNIVCASGPSISAKSYEVQIDFKKRIIKKKQADKIFFKTKKNKLFFDLKGYALSKILKEKIKKNNVEMINFDTYSKPKLFYSFRRSVHKKEYDYGRNLSIIVKKESLI